MFGVRNKEAQDTHANDEENDLGFTVTDRRFWADEDEVKAGTEDARAEVPTYVERLQREVEQKNQQLKEYIAAYKTEVVEGLEQTKARLERDMEQRISALRGELAVPMMEVLEALERSLMAAETNADPDAMREGLKLLQMLMVQKLGDFGLQRIETVGAPFDPAVHDAIAVVPVTQPEQENVVMAEFSPGFTLGGRVVRAAKVQVGKC